MQRAAVQGAAGDDRQRWQDLDSVPAPAVSLVPTFTASPRSAVSMVRFENASDGWLFAPRMWATTNGGEQWHRVLLPGEVIALAASAGEVFAATEPVNGGLNAARLYESQVGTTKWNLVPGVTPATALTSVRPLRLGWHLAEVVGVHRQRKALVQAVLPLPAHRAVPDCGGSRVGSQRCACVFRRELPAARPELQGGVHVGQRRAYLPFGWPAG